MTDPKISLKLVTAPATGFVLRGPARARGERSFSGLYLWPLQHRLAACRGKPSSRYPHPLHKLRII